MKREKGSIKTLYMMMKEHYQRGRGKKIYWLTTATDDETNKIALRKFINARAKTANSCLRRTYVACIISESHVVSVWWSGNS
jgi:hypothetical protein